MRRVWTTRGLLLPLVLLAALVFIGRGVQETQASAFNPVLTASLGSSGAGATSDINETADFGTGVLTPTRSFPASSVYFTPANWGIPNCAPTASCPYAFDEKTGDFTSTTTFGLLGSQCAIAIPVVFPNGMRNASTDPSDSIPPGTAFANLNADADTNGKPDGTEHWNDLLNGLIAAGLLPSTPPRERQILSTAALGTQVWVDVLTYDPGLLGGAASAPLGYATTFILQNANPLNPPSPSLITDTCGLFNGFTQAGLASGGATHRTNPGPGTSLFFFQAGSQRDADQGPSAPVEPAIPGPLGLSGQGFVNSLDTCPFTPNSGSPIFPAASSSALTGDPAESPGDGIDAACDVNPLVFDGTDVDFDAYLNRGDNCIYVANGPGGGTNNQGDVSEVAGPAAANEVGQQPVDGGPASDSIGDDCDLNLQVPDGHFHSRLLAAPVCVGLADGDGDGWCDLSEGGLGSNPASAASTPEALAVPGSCSDGADNDGDAATDLNDTACQLTMHDLSIKKLNGNTAVPCAGGTVEYNLLINNPGAADTAEVSIYLDSQPSYIPLGPAPYAPSKSAGSVSNVASGDVAANVTASGLINIDGDADVEWLAKVVLNVKKSPATTTLTYSVTYPPVSPCSGAGTTDFLMTVDVCHGNDVAPLGVGPLNGNCAASATSDGGQDRNSGNDITSRNIDAQ